MAALLASIDRAGKPPFHSMSAIEARRLYDASAELLDLPRAPLARVENLELPVADGALLRARLFAPSSERLPVLLYFHGGGFTIGSLETHDSLLRQFALRSGAAVLAVAYRLAPEYRFPVAVDDSWDALRWLAEHAIALGLDGARLAVGGDSAGGTLAAVAAVHARDIGLALRLQVLITPGTTAHADTPSHRRHARGYLLDAETIEWFFAHYIDRERRSDWRFAPLEADDLDGVAPACVVLAECDPLVDEGIAYADRLRAAGVGVELELCRGLTHDFIKMGRMLPEARAAQALIGAALRRAFDEP
ncbi:MAG: alpha/beta hydrolase [Proteobacteria bacterium]|nr:alpha/beta hydrolase [Pseudomonadota bacterium]